MNYIGYEVDTGITCELITTNNIEGRKREGYGYIEAPESFSPKMVGLTKVVGGEIHPYTPPVDEEELWNKLRIERNRRLSACDFTQFPDSPYNTELWAEYRELLRNLPSTIEDITQPVIWPQKPE
jgi:hypothetical protein